MSNGFVFYEGLSQIDNSPIVGIATIKSKNRKTGDMVQTWMIRSDIHPLEAIKTKGDISVCGDCKLRNGACYVLVYQAPSQIWKQYKAGNYPKLLSPYMFANRLVRLGSYGDPVSIPINMWNNILATCKGHTGFSHQWKNPKFQDYKEFLMASVDNEQEAKLAQSMGWRTFRVTTNENKLKGEILCLNNNVHKVITCADCLLCDGLFKGKKSNIVEPIHGTKAKIKNFEKLSLSTIGVSV